jgi:hypothetical protein
MHIEVLLGVLALILLSALVGVALPAQLHIHIEGNELVIRPRWLDVLLCNGRRIAVPMSTLRTIEAVDWVDTPERGHRRTGVWLPWLVRAGTFGTGRATTFWDVRRPGRVLVIRCVDTTLILGVADPDGTAARLNAGLVRQ